MAVILFLIIVLPNIVLAFGVADFSFFFGGTVEKVIRPCPVYATPFPDPVTAAQFAACTAGGCIPGESLVILKEAFPMGKGKVGPMSLDNEPYKAGKGNICLLNSAITPTVKTKILGFGPSFNAVVWFMTTGVSTK